MRNVIGNVVLGLAVVGLAVGCGGGGGGTTEGTGDGTTGGESAYAGPIGSTDVAHGQARFEAVCGACHNGGNGPALVNIAFTTEHMRRQIREGEDSMPAIRESRLSAEDMEAVLAYLQTVGAVTDEAAAAEPQPAAE